MLVAGCASAPETEEIPDTLPAGVWDVEAGEKLSPDQFFERLDAARFVVIGESHGERWHHEVQRQIYAELSDRRPGEVALGMEMVERRFQGVVDDYLDETIDETAMLEGVEWYRRWDVDDELYAPMWRRARREGQPVVALNARRELVRRVGQVGLDGLDDEERAELPDIERDDRAYREHLRHMATLHGQGQDVEEELDRFFEAQLVWDETMAETAYEFMAERPTDEQMVLLTGRGHMERGFGIPPRLIRRKAAPESVVTVLPVSTGGPRAAAAEKYRDLAYLRGEEIADYVWIGE